jgi:hypothetical protein
VALLHREARVLKEDADDSGFRVEAMTGEKIDSILGEYRTEEV